MSPTPADAPARPRPHSLLDYFLSLTVLALQGFGGVLAVVQNELVERKRWLSREEFVEEWAVAQVMPGPNVVNLAIILGNRYFGWKGSVVGVAGILSFPILLVVGLAMLYAGFADNPRVAGALRGMGAVAAGLIAAVGLKLGSSFRTNPLGIAVCLALAATTFLAIALLRLPLALVLFGLGGDRLRTGVEKAAVTATEWLSMAAHFALLSLMTVGGAITTAPEMHRYCVIERGWLTDPQFSSSIAIAQAAPGPNVLFVALIGWNIGLNAGGLPLAAAGMLLALLAILVPSSALVYATASWSHRNKDLRAVRAFKVGMGPIVVALLVSAGWILATGQRPGTQQWQLWAATLATTFIVWRTRIHLLWLLGVGATLGWFGVL